MKILDVVHQRRGRYTIVLEVGDDERLILPIDMRRESTDDEILERVQSIVDEIDTDTNRQPSGLIGKTVQRGRGNGGTNPRVPGQQQ